MLLSISLSVHALSLFSFLRNIFEFSLSVLFSSHRSTVCHFVNLALAEQQTNFALLITSAALQNPLTALFSLHTLSVSLIVTAISSLVSASLPPLAQIPIDFIYSLAVGLQILCATG